MTAGCAASRLVLARTSGRSAPCVQPNTPDGHQREHVRSARDVSPRSVQFSVAIDMGQSQAAFAAMLGASPESYRTWDAGRRATPLKILARARALATHRDDHAFLPLPVLALLIGVHVKTLRSAARDGRLPVTYDTQTTFRQLRARATLAAVTQFRHAYGWPTGAAGGPSRVLDLGQCARRLR